MSILGLLINKDVDFPRFKVEKITTLDILIHELKAFMILDSCYLLEDNPQEGRFKLMVRFAAQGREVMTPWGEPSGINTGYQNNWVKYHNVVLDLLERVEIPGYPNKEIVLQYRECWGKQPEEEDA
jgi:hypothetical protein